MFTNQFWLITLTKDVESKFFYGQEISIKSEKYLIEDPNSFARFYTYKVMWLPHNFNQRIVSKFFESRKYKIEYLREEFMQEEEFKNIKTGNYIVRVKIDDDKVRILESDIYTIEGMKTFIRE